MMQASKMFLVLMIMYAAGELSVSLSVQSEGYCTNCDPNPCLNGGTCDESTSHTGSDYKCYCPQGFSGETCEFDVCDSHDCQNGTCEADESNLRGYRCNCVTGYIGNNCDVDVCDDHDCRNGDCEADQSSIRGYRCKCVTGYIGDNCEVDVCGSNVCQNGGSCEADKSQVRGFTCICINDYVGDNCEVLPVDCKDLHNYGHINSGVYIIYPFGEILSPLGVYCDMETLNGGWTVIQKRVDGSTSFDKLWSEYKEGFGSPEQNVWIGNDVIHQLTKGNGSSLYVSITQVSGTTLYELYGRFSIANEAEKYRLFLAGNVTGTLGDSMLNTIDPDEHDLSGMYFSTHDNNNDLSGGFNCAAEAGGGWWFRDCYSAFLNGLWSSTAWANPWAPTIRSGTSVSKTLMMIKRH